MVKIITVPSDTLRKVAKPVEGVDVRILDLLKDMQEILKKAKDPQGVGLAATQVGVPLRIFLTRPIKNGAMHTFINPEIIGLSQKTVDPHRKDGVYEGCLSIPDVRVEIERPASLMLRYVDRDGTARELAAEGLLATAIQHEINHLDGKLIIDFLSTLKRDMVVRKFKKQARTGDVL